MQSFLTRWFCTTIAVAAAVKLTGMHAETVWALATTALFLGIINALVRPVLLLLSLPFIVVTFGLFYLVINAILLEAAGGLVPGFHVGGFWNAFFGAIIVSLVSGCLNLFFAGNQESAQALAPQEREMKQVEGRVLK
jgi:putative membrane protein